MGSEEGQKHRLMKIRLEKEEHSGDFVISAAVEIESDDPSWAMRKAKELLAICDGSREWAQQWAELAERAGWPCWGMSWREWAADVAQGHSRRKVEALARWPDDPPPMEPCRPFGAGEHRMLWRRPDKWGGGWVCTVCYPAHPDVEVETWEMPT